MIAKAQVNFDQPRLFRHYTYYTRALSALKRMMHFMYEGDYLLCFIKQGGVKKLVTVNASFFLHCSAIYCTFYSLHSAI